MQGLVPLMQQRDHILRDDIKHSSESRLVNIFASCCLRQRTCIRDFQQLICIVFSFGGGGFVVVVGLCFFVHLVVFCLFIFPPHQQYTKQGVFVKLFTTSLHTVGYIQNPTSGSVRSPFTDARILQYITVQMYI